MTVDKKYCMSSFLMFRTIKDEEKCFSEKYKPYIFHVDFPRTPIYTSDDLYNAIKLNMEKWTSDGKAAIALSGGIDSAILAKFMPKGSTAYTFKCIVPGIEVTDESITAAKYAEECGLKHKIIEIYWEDFEKYAPMLMKSKGCPIHSIEVQIYKAAMQAKKDGFERFIFGETADCLYGGHSKLLSRDWTFGEFVDRYSYVKPYTVLKDYDMLTDFFKPYEKNGYIDVFEFCRTFILEGSMGSYINACKCADIEFLTPYLYTWLAAPFDYNRNRNGESKYLVREIFKKLYPNFEIPQKTPMPRPMNEWFENWKGPTRLEFYPHCTDDMTGDQKWLVWALEKFLNILDADN